MAPSPRLTLYHYPSCGYCQRVFRVLDQLGLDIERLNIDEDASALADLVKARGRRAVPVLRIEDADGQSTWMPESQDIIAYLRANVVA
jgi:glutaredoxin